MGRPVLPALSCTSRHRCLALASLLLALGLWALPVAADRRGALATVAATAQRPLGQGAASTPLTATVTLPPVYITDTHAVYAINADGSNSTLVATLPLSASVGPQLLPDGRLLYPSGEGFATVDGHGVRGSIRVPDRQAGETVWSIVPSPDGRTLAWQFFSPLQLPSYTVNTGSGRIVLTGRFGDAGTTVATGQARAEDGQVPLLIGWRAQSPYSVGGATLLLSYLYSGQHLYRAQGLQSGVQVQSQRGLLEYDPAIGDIVNDDLPPLDLDLPLQTAFSVSTSGRLAVYGDRNVFTPSGEGPLAQTLAVLNLDTLHVTALDSAAAYTSTGVLTGTVTTKVGHHTVRRTVTTPLHLYHYISHHASIAPGEGRVLYTLLTVSYPPGVLAPQVRRTALVATLDGRKRSVVAENAVAQGWLDGHHAVVARNDGLYSIDVVFGGQVRLATGHDLQFLGSRLAAP